jgi:hypothetical protein
MQNQSPDAVQLIGHTIASNGWALRTDWHGLAARGNATAQQLSELSPMSSESLAAQAVLNFGTTWHTSGGLDLTFQYQTADGVNHTGPVVEPS